MVQQEQPQAWWFDSHNLSRQSRWLVATLSDLEGKTKQMLKLIDQDADSFAQRAELYYKKRPLLVNMLGDLYRSHRSLAEQHDLLRSGRGTRHTPFGPASSMQASPMAMRSAEAGLSSFSLSPGAYDPSESELDDPEAEETDGDQGDDGNGDAERIEAANAEIGRLEEQNAALRAELASKDEEKREVIRQLAAAIDILKEENDALRESVRDCSPRRRHGFDLKKMARDLFSGRMFTAHRRASRPLIAL